MGKNILKHKKEKKIHITRIILHYYILYNGDAIYVGTFPVNIRMTLNIYRFSNRKLIFTTYFLNFVHCVLLKKRDIGNQTRNNTYLGMKQHLHKYKLLSLSLNKYCLRESGLVLSNVNSNKAMVHNF